MPQPIKVLVVDDSSFMRRAVQQMLTSDPTIEIVGVGRNGLDAVNLARDLRPDVITLDIEMPGMDGLTALRRIMREAPTNVIMVSSLTTEGSVAALQALRLGAVDFLAKQHATVDMKINEIRDDLVRKVKAIGRHRHARPAGQVAGFRDVPAAKLPDLSGHRFDAVCVGSSTGGPPLLETLLAQLPVGFSPSVIVAQHMPALFTRSMADRLKGLCALPVLHAEDGMEVARGSVYIAPGGKHLHLEKLGLTRQRIRISDEPADHLYRPSVDVLLSTAAAVFGRRCLGIVLTGIGEDGLRGARQLHAAGGPILAQSAATCVVYGMPRAVTEAGLVTASLSPADIARTLAALAPASAAA